MPLTNLNTKRNQAMLAVETYKLDPSESNKQIAISAIDVYSKEIGQSLKNNPELNEDDFFSDPQVITLTKRDVIRQYQLARRPILEVNLSLASGHWRMGQGWISDATGIGTQIGPLGTPQGEPVRFTHENKLYSLHRVEFRNDLKFLLSMTSQSTHDVASIFTKLKVVVDDGFITLNTNDHINTLTTVYARGRYININTNHPDIANVNSLIGKSQTINVKLYIED